MTDAIFSSGAGGAGVAGWCGAALAQEAGAAGSASIVEDVTQADADSLGWEAPRGAKITRVIEGSPAEVAGLETDDILVSLDRVEIENAAGFLASLDVRAAGAQIRLSIRRAGRERRLAAVLGAEPVKAAANSDPLLMLDTGGHMALIKDIAFTPDGTQLVSASDDKVIRVWDLASGKTVRTIRGESAPGDAGKIYAMALSPDGKWLAAGGWLRHPTEQSKERHAIRLYDFASGRLVALLKGHENVVSGLAFSPDGRHLISGSFDKTAILWDVDARALKHRLRGHTDDIYAVGFTPDGQRAVTGAYDNDLRLWRVRDGRQIGPR